MEETEESMCVLAFLSSVDDDEEYSLQSVDVVFVVVGGFLCEVCSVLSHPTHIVAPAAIHRRCPQSLAEAPMGTCAWTLKYTLSTACA